MTSVEIRKKFLACRQYRLRDVDQVIFIIIIIIIIITDFWIELGNPEYWYDWISFNSRILISQCILHSLTNFKGIGL